MQIQSTATAATQSTTSTTPSPQATAPAEAQPTQLADDSVQLSNAALAAAGPEQLNKPEMGIINVPPP